MSTGSPVNLSIQSGIATLTLNRPSVKNALNREMAGQFTQYLKDISENNTLHAVVLRGAGGHFCSGADIHWMMEASKLSPEENQQDAFILAELFYLLNHLNKPTIAIVEGCAFGGGIGLIACCDIVLASTDATFRFAEVTLGLVAATIAPYVMTAIGPRACRRYLLTAELFGAANAHALGLVHTLVKKEALETTLTLFLEALHQNGPKAVQTTKKLIQTLTEKLANRELSEYTAHLIAEVRASKEAQEGMQAFLEKRSPKWQKGKS